MNPLNPRETLNIENRDDGLWAIPFALACRFFAIAVVCFCALAGCAPHFTTLAAGTADGVTCTEWSAVHPIAGTTTAMTCRDETGKLWPVPSSHSSSAVANLFSQFGDDLIP